MKIMDTLLYHLWGKTNERGPRKKEWKWAYHPAVCHMIDVAYMADEWLKMNPRILDRFCMLAPGIDREMLHRIIVFLVALHDLGKLHIRFQGKSGDGWEAGYGLIGMVRDPQPGFDHGRGTAVIMRLLFRKGLFRSWRSWQTAIDVIAAHHGKLYTSGDLVAPDYTLMPPVTKEVLPYIIEAVEVFRRLFDAPECPPEAPLDNSFHMLLAGFTSVADWLGSNAADFPFVGDAIQNEEDLHGYLQGLREKGVGERALRKVGLDSRFKEIDLTYEDLFDFLRDKKLRPLQEASKDVPFGEMPGSEMVIVEAPMGNGKTEISLYFATRAITKSHADGIYMALPTQASSNNLFKRITRYADAVRSTEGSLSVVLAHGGRRFEEHFQTMLEKRREVYRQYERTRAALGGYRDSAAPPSEVIATDWLTQSKHVLLAGIGVGTIDQAMLGAIGVNHAFVRLSALATKVVILDEIHAYDLYMNEVIFHLLRWLNALGTKVVILSATLPQGLRRKLLESYGCEFVSSVSSPEDEPYPLMLYAAASEVARPFEPPPEEEKEKNQIRVAIRMYEAENHKDPEMSPRTLRGVAEALRLVRMGGCIAWIRNTVRETQAAWRVLRNEIRISGETDIEVVILHARYPLIHRNKRQDELLDRLGKEAEDKRPKKMIVIATQVIEQSIDIDFDAMISDLAPVDLLLQRAGRMWRHDRPIEVRYDHIEPTLYILAPTLEERYRLVYGGSGRIYDREVLARSACIVKKSAPREENETEGTEAAAIGDHEGWILPHACRRLVAWLYDQDAEYWTAEKLNVDEKILERAREKKRNDDADAMSQAHKILMPAVDAETLAIEIVRKDDDNSASVALATRQGVATATIVLLEQRNGSIHFMDTGVAIDPLPAPEHIDPLLRFEEAVMMTTVSFIWWGKEKPAPPPYTDSRLTTLDRWWRERHPFDNKIFVLVGGDGAIDHPLFFGYYRRDEHGEPLEGLDIRQSREEEQEEQVIATD